MCKVRTSTEERDSNFQQVMRKTERAETETLVRVCLGVSVSLH